MLQLGLDFVYFFITSKQNSPGLTYWKWNDGKPLMIGMNKNTLVTYNIQPQITNYIKETDKCQQESYYECIASQFDVSKLTECPNKCIPNIFPIWRKNTVPHSVKMTLTMKNVLPSTL